MKMVLVKEISRFALRLERKELDLNGRSLTAGTIAQAANPFIAEVVNENAVWIKSGWREAMKKKAHDYE